MKTISIITLFYDEEQFYSRIPAMTLRIGCHAYERLFAGKSTAPSERPPETSADLIELVQGLFLAKNKYRSLR